MPIVQSSSVVLVDGVASTSATLNGVTAGNCLVVTGLFFANNGETYNFENIAITGETGFTKHVSQGQAGSPVAGGVIGASKQNATGGNTTITLAADTGNISAAWQLHEVSGVPTTGDWWAATSVSGSGTNAAPASGSLTTTAADAILIGVAEQWNNGDATLNWVGPSGFTELGNYGDASAAVGYHACYKTVSSTGSYSATWGIDTGGNWAAGLFALKQSSGGLTLNYGEAGAVAYSTSGGSSVSPAYPTNITTNSALVLFVGQKPATANGGGATTPSGWTLIGSVTGANDGDTGGYSTTLGADTGNTNLFVYRKDAVSGSESGSLSVTVSDNNVSWAQILRLQASAACTWSFDYGTGKDTSAGSVSIVTGNMSVASGDLLVGAMCVPTDVSTPSQFSSEAFSQTGTTFGAATEVSEPDTTTGNDIGAFVCYAPATAGSGTGAVTMTATAGGTTTNVRGPGVVLRVRVASTTSEFAATDAPGSGQSTGALTTQIQLAGASVAGATATGVVVSDLNLYGAAATATLSEGLLTTQIRFDAAAVAAALAEANLTLPADVSGSATGGAQSEGVLTTAIQMAGAAAGAAQASGVIPGSLYWVVYPTADSAPSAAQVKAGQRSTGAAATASGRVDARVTTGEQVFDSLVTGLPAGTNLRAAFAWWDGSSSSNVSVSSEFTTVEAPALAGGATGSAQATGEVSILLRLDAAAVVSALVAGVLDTDIRFAGSAVASALATGDIIQRANFVADALASADAEGLLTEEIGGGGELPNLIGTAAAVGSATAAGAITVPLAATLVGAATGRAISTGTLKVGARFFGSPVGSASASGSMSTWTLIAGSATGVAVSSAGLTTAIRFTGAVAGASQATGTLDIGMALRADALASALAGGVLSVQVALDAAAVASAIAEAELGSAPGFTEAQAIAIAQRNRIVMLAGEPMRPFAFDFRGRLANGETITSATVTVTCPGFETREPNPQELAFGQAEIAGRLVVQYLNPMVAAARYRLSCHATTSQSRDLYIGSIVRVLQIWKSWRRFV